MSLRMMAVVTMALAACLAGCAEQLAVTHTTAQPQAAVVVPTGLLVRVEPCVNRMDPPGQRDVAGEATQALTDRLRKSKDLVICDNARLLLTCDVERFVEGSAFERWLMPGLGPTMGAAAVTLWDTATQEVLLTLRSQSSVKSGGLFSIGADKTIFRSVFNQLVSQLEQWSRGYAEDTKAGRAPPPATQPE